MFTPCTKCGNCCRIATECDLYAWRNAERWNAGLDGRRFEPPCPELREDNLCGIVVDARAGLIPDLNPTALRYLDTVFSGRCSNLKVRKP
jgi:hypothetical protein